MYCCIAKQKFPHFLIQFLVGLALNLLAMLYGGSGFKPEPKKTGYPDSV
jgi:hypothetical protein